MSAEMFEVHGGRSLLQVEEGVEAPQPEHGRTEGVRSAPLSGSLRPSARRLKRQPTFVEEPMLDVGRSTHEEKLNVAVPWVGRMAWHIVNFGICLMLVGGQTSFCEDYANRASYNPNVVLNDPVVPIWPPDISSGAANFNTPGGRFFFVGMLLGGGLLLSSNVLNASICQDLDPSTGGFRIIRVIVALVCLALILTGTCSIRLFSTSFSNNPRQSRETVSTFVHLSGATVIFVALPIMEIAIVVVGSSRFGGWRYFLSVRKIRIVRVALSLVAILCFCEFYYLQQAVTDKWTTYIQNNDKLKETSNDWRMHTASSLNMQAYWFEYATAECALAVIATRVFTVTQGRGWLAETMTSEETTKSIMRVAPWYYFAAAIGIQFACILAGVGSVMMTKEDPSSLCCACSLTGTKCEALYTTFNGTLVCTFGPRLGLP